jgi:hypothetical protein
VRCLSLLLLLFRAARRKKASESKALEARCVSHEGSISVRARSQPLGLRPSHVNLLGIEPLGGLEQLLSRAPVVR